MKVFLLYCNRDFDPNSPLPTHAAALSKDLEIDRVFGAMAAGDAFLLDVAKKTLFGSLMNSDEILYRQQILTDCMNRAEVVREIYAIAVEAAEREKRVWGSIFGRYPESSLSRSIDVLRIFVGLIERLRVISDHSAAEFQSEGLRRFFRMIKADLDDAYLATAKGYLQRLTFKRGVLMSAALEKGNRPGRFVLLKPRDDDPGWFERLKKWIQQQLFGEDSPGRLVYQIHDRDEAGARVLGELKGLGISHVASALAQSTDHILSFFTMLRLELGFYVGCLNLRDRLLSKRESLCMPEPRPREENVLSARGLYDASLSLSIEDRTVGNDLEACGKSLIMITGANRGGKSTFLRSIGLAELMMQCGMFVPALSYRASLCEGLYTHFKREEDSSLKSGKLDEELSRMSEIVGSIKPHALILFNESFGSTNEREGSEIARQIVRGLLDAHIKVAYVTHMFDLANGFFAVNLEHTIFLRAERLADGSRTFRVEEGPPLKTSYGEDLYRRIFKGQSALTSDTAIEERDSPLLPRKPPV